MALPTLPALGLGSSLTPLQFGARAASRRPQREQFTSEEQGSLMRSLTQGTLGGIATAANFLDTPDAMIRAALVGRNPLTGFANAEDRITGRDVLEHWGVLGKNTPGFDWGDVAGVAAEIPLGITGWISAPFGALSKAGRAAKAAGVLGDAAKVASTAAGKTVGKRVARMTTTLGDVVSSLPGAKQAATRQAVLDFAKGDAAEAARLMGEKLGGNLGVGLPFREPAFVANLPLGGQKVAGWLDTAGRKISESLPGRLVQQGFMPSRMAAFTNEVQAHTPGLYRAQTESQVTAKGITEELIKIRAQYKLDDTAEPWLRRLYTAKQPADIAQAAADVSAKYKIPAAEVQRLRDTVRSTLDRMPNQAAEWGVSAKRLDDTANAYFPASLEFKQKEGTIFGGEELAAKIERESKRSFTAAYENQLHRKDFLKDLGGAVPGQQYKGREQLIDEMASDPRMMRMMRQGASRRDIARYIRDKWGTGGTGEVPELYTKRMPGGTTVDKNRYMALADWFGRFDEDIRKAGIYRKGTTYDFQARIAHHEDAIRAAEFVRDVLLEKDVLQPATLALRHEGTKSLRSVLKKLHIDAGDVNRGFLRKLAEAQNPGAPITGAMIDDLGRLQVRADVAKDLERVMVPFSSPHEYKAWMQAIDSGTNLFKALVTGPWPAFVIRNRGSGIFRNLSAGMYSPWSERATHNVMAAGGKLSPELAAKVAKIPFIEREMAQMGLNAANPADVKEAVSRLAYRYGIIGRYQGEAAQRQGVLGQMLSTSFADEVRGFPGGIGQMGEGVSATKIGKKWIGMEGGTTWNPWPTKGKIRGVLGASETMFAPVAAGEDANYYVEGMNRLSPWLHELSKGTDPMVAKLKVGAAQVDYAAKAFTPLERTWMTRLMPFYKFSSRQIPYVVRELWEHPRGLTGTAIQAATRARDPGSALPEYVSESTAIPLPSGVTGQQRYLTGLGLMHEDPLKLLSPDLSKTGQELLGRMNPFLKSPIEYATGQTFFQRGRRLEDVDPLLGRIASNIRGLAEPAKVAADREAFKFGMEGPVLGEARVLMEQAAANSPFARLFTTVRKLTDPRKRMSENLPIPGLLPMAELVSGVKVTDVSPAAQDAILREATKDVIRKTPGSRVFEKVYFSKEEKAKMAPDERRSAEQLEAIMDMLAERAKARKVLKQQRTVAPSRFP